MEKKGVNVQSYSSDVSDRCPQPITLNSPECYVEGGLRNRWVKKLITQYGASNRLIKLLCVYVEQVELLVKAICDFCSDINSAEGDCLCRLGSQSGFSCLQCGVFSSNHSIKVVSINDCDDPASYRAYFSQPVYTDFEFDTSTEIGASYYRNFLRSWNLKRSSNGTPDQLINAAQALWPDDEPKIIFQGGGEIYLSIGRNFTVDELKLIKLFEKVLPITRGVKLYLVEIV